MEYLVSTYTLEGEMVLDVCAGSGSTGLAAKNLDRDFILIEKEEKYFETIRRRLLD
jgi:DNA modification methylase